MKFPCVEGCTKTNTLVSKLKLSKQLWGLDPNYYERKQFAELVLLQTSPFKAAFEV